MTIGLAPSAARASCVSSPDLTMVPASGVESHGFDFTWAAVPTGGGCSGFSLDHYVIAIKESSYPLAPTSGMALNAGSSLTGRLLPHRAERTYYAKLFACDNSTCSDIFGFAGPETFARTDEHDELAIDATDQEVWEIVGLDDADGGITGLDDETNDPGSFFFPPGWTNAGQLAIYGYDQESTEQNLKVIVAETAGWQNFNTATFSAAVDVAGDHSSDGDFDYVSHPYPRPVTRSATEQVLLLAQNAGGTNQVVWADSVDELGDDFDLYSSPDVCAGSASSDCDWPTAETNGTAGVALEPTAYNFTSMMHGHWMWNYITAPTPEMTTDHPSILFTGDPGGGTCGQQGPYAEADIYKATWNGSAWITYDSADGAACLDALIFDAHDPAVTPLPDNASKIYVVGHGQDVKTYYYDGSAIETSTASPSFIWGNGGAPVSDDCIANMDSFAMIEGGVPHEGMLFYLHNDEVDFQTGFCHEGSNYTGTTQTRIYFAELTN